MTVATRSRSGAKQKQCSSPAKSAGSTPSKDSSPPRKRSKPETPPKNPRLKPSASPKSPLAKIVRTLRPRRKKSARRGSRKDKSLTGIDEVSSNLDVAFDRKEEPSQANAVIDAGTNDNVVRLVYPFEPDAQSDYVQHNNQVSEDLFDGIDRPTVASAASPLMGECKTGTVTLLQRDFSRLEPGKLLSDSNIDFWLKWMTRNLPADAPVIVLSSLFYTCLKHEGEEKANSFLNKNNTKVFDADIIFVPITQECHHSLCAIINPGSIAHTYTGNESRESRRPLLVAADSKDFHDSNEISRNLRKWLNHCWAEETKRVASTLSEPRPFTKRKMPVVFPSVPKQINDKDCGVFLCRYAVGILRLYERLNGEISTNKIDCCALVSKAPELRFGLADIAQFRADMKTLTERLSAHYVRVKSLLPPMNYDCDSPEVIEVRSGGEQGQSSLIKAAAYTQNTPSVSNVSHTVTLTIPRQSRKATIPCIGTPFKPDLSSAVAKSVEFDSTFPRGTPSTGSVSTLGQGSPLLLDDDSSKDEHSAKTNDASMASLLLKLGSWSLGASVDGDEHNVRASPRGAVDLTEDRIQVDVEAPPGALGFKVHQVSKEWVKVEIVYPDSVMYRRILEGDLISHVGNWSARGKTYLEVADEFNRTKLLPRFIRLWRLESLYDETKFAGAVKRKRPVAGHPDEDGTAAKAAPSGGSTASQGNSKAAEKSSSNVLPSMYTREGCEALEQEAKSKEAKRKAQSHKIQKVGTYATRLSDLNGQGVQRQMRQMFKILFRLTKMTTPVGKINGIETKGWPLTQPFSITFEKWHMSNPNGGHRPESPKDMMREKTLIVICCRNQQSVDEFKAAFGHSWPSDDEYEVRIVFDEDSAMTASYGHRKRRVKKAKNDESKKRTINGSNTPAQRVRRRKRAQA